jgi:hypothetical protein
MQFLRSVRASSVMTFYANVPQISVVSTGMVWTALADVRAHSILYVPCIQYISEGIKGSDVVDISTLYRI